MIPIKNIYVLITLIGLISLHGYGTFQPLNTPYLYNAFFSPRFQDLRKPNLVQDQGTKTLSETQKSSLKEEAESNIAFHINKINKSHNFSEKQFLTSILFGGLSGFLYHNSKYASSNSALTTAIILGGTITGCATNLLYNYIKRHDAFAALTKAKNYIDQQGYTELILNPNTSSPTKTKSPLNLRPIANIAKDKALLNKSRRFYKTSGSTLDIPALRTNNLTQIQQPR